jgi:hypothetical protein
MILAGIEPDGERPSARAASENVDLTGTDDGQVPA